MAGPDLSALEQRYKLPSGILAATRQVESSGNPNAVSEVGAQGGFQLMPDTARSLGVDPFHPEQAAEGAARLWRQNLDASNGDIDRAAMMYHGGPNTKIWGPKTRAYPGKILAALGTGGAPAQAAAPDPFEAAMSGHSDTPSHDPFEAQMEAGKSGNAQAVPDQSGNRTGDPGSQGDPNRGPDGSGNVPLAPGADGGNAGQVAGGGTGAAPLPQGPGNPQSGGTGVTDFIRGIPEGWGDLQTDIVKLGARGTDALGISHGALDRLDAAEKALKAGTSDPLYDTPDGWGRAIGRFTGEAAAGAPLTELKPLEALGIGGKGGKLASALAKYGDMSAQGAAFGTVASGGHDIAENAAIGAVGAPVLGKALSIAARPVVGAFQKLAGPAESLNTKMSNALRERMAGGMAPKEAPPMEPAFLRSEPPAPPPGVPAVGEDGAPFIGMGEAGGQSFPQYGEALSKGLKAAGARSGIEATPALPEAATQDFQQLVKSGVPEDQALNEAAIKYVGGKPTIGTVTRDRIAQEAEREGAKLTTPEGQALANRAAENNAALHETAQTTVQNYGGVPAAGEAAETTATSLAKSSDAAKAQVSAAYESARAQDGDQRVSIDGLRELLAKPSYKAPTTAEGKQLVAGLKSQITAMAKENGGRFTPDEIDQLAKAASQAYNPMGGGANHMVGEVKAALNASLDQFDKAGPAYKQARALHRDWAKQYDDPKGIADIIRRDVNGNFVNDDNWRRVENGLIGTTSDKAFSQVVRQIQKTGDTHALDRLKADIVQRAYEAATKSAADHAGNPNFSAKQWEASLNKIGLPKLKALFTPEEIAHLATVGRAARAMNEAVPGTVNGSNTTSKLANALRSAQEPAKAHPVASVLGKGVKFGAHVAVGHLAPGIGNAGVEGAAAAAAKVSGIKASAASQKALADAINKSLDPQAARAAANDDAISAAEAARRGAIANSLAKRIAPAVAHDRGNR